MFSLWKISWGFFYPTVYSWQLCSSVAYFTFLYVNEVYLSFLSILFHGGGEETMTKADLVEKIASQVSLSKKDSETSFVMFVWRIETSFHVFLEAIRVMSPELRILSAYLSDPVSLPVDTYIVCKSDEIFS